MEQHPTLPVVAVSGIDNTIKMFSPMTKPPTPSFSRLHLRDEIIEANMDRSNYTPSSAFGTASLLDFLAARGISARFMNGGAEEDENGQPQCATQ
jgi:WD and tetratricopeptide repeat-containing protein 1